MTSFAGRALIPTLTAATVLVLLAGPAAVQARNPYRRAVVPAPSPYWGYAWNPYGWWDPYASELHGVAAIIRAQGDFLVQSQQALLIREKVRRERLETHHAELLHWEWVRDFQAGSFNRREASYARSALERSLAPTLTTGEIISAGALNTLLKQLEVLPQLPEQGSTSIDAEVLSKINFTVNGHGNAGLLKQDRLWWPPLLCKPEFKEDREAITQLFNQAREMALSKAADSVALADVLSQMRRRLADWRQRFTQRMRSRGNELDPDWGPIYVVPARKCLDELDATIRLLGQRDASFYATTLQGKTVAELVKYMKSNGIEFDAATTGSERYYKALHARFADEYRRLQPSLTNTNPR